MISEKLGEEIYAENYAYVLGVISSTERDRAPDEDILQEVFLKVFQSFDQLRDKTKFRPWLRRITVNQCYEHYRRRRETLPITFDIPDHYAQFDFLLDRDMIERGLRQLKPEEQELIVLKYLLDIKCADIAAILNITANNVQVRLHRAKNKLREILKAQTY
ncbi:MAG: sigma-70 family RNA polymerase sigma factor [Gracilibacteraceae bacterium]|jgi:RNA polymerase sigma-70 factor (ECF subfamily)|nr:sigma-70 family RNA polymerase sigma factor [Gracilibacteraceae bacterium]